MITIRRAMLSLLAGVCLVTAAGCEITTCEEGAVCTDEDGTQRSEQESSCVLYCGRLSVCGASQAEDFDDCVEACQERFERLPEQTAELCECAPWSRCEDVLEGRCSEGPPPGGGGGNGGGSGGTNGCGAPGGCSSGGGPSSGGAGVGTGGSAPGSGGAPNHSGGAGGTPSQAGAGGAAGACPEDCDCTPE